MNQAAIFRITYYFTCLIALGSALFSDFLPMPQGAYADQRLLLVIILVLVTAVCAWQVQSIVAVDTARLLITAPFLLSFLLGGWLSADQAFSWVEPLLYVFFFLAVFLSGTLLFVQGGHVVSVRRFAQCAAAACLFYGLATISVYMFAIGDKFSKLVDVIPWGFVNIRHWSHIATWLLPILPLATVGFNGRKWRLWRAGVALAASLWWWMVFLTMSRGTVVGLLIGTLVVLVIFRSAALLWLRLMIFYFLLGVIAWAVLSIAIPALVFDVPSVRELYATTSGRIPLWQEAFAMSMQNFPFGMGAQSWLTHNILTDAYRASPKLGHPHNMYLMWAAEYGWLSIFGLILLGAWSVRQLVLKSTVMKGEGAGDPYSSALIAYTASVIAALVHAGVSAVFIVPASMLVGFCVMSLFWALVQPESVGMLQQNVMKTRLGPMLAVVVLIVGSGWLSGVWRYHQAMVIDKAYYDAHVPERHLPRFWFHGNFPRSETSMVE